MEDAMAKSKTKDLPAGKDVKGGGRKLCNDSPTLIRAAKPAKKDLAAPSSAPVKGGLGKRLNDNLTLVRTP
jgi:hypothetical protein